MAILDETRHAAQVAPLVPALRSRRQHFSSDFYAAWLIKTETRKLAIALFDAIQNCLDDAYAKGAAQGRKFITALVAGEISYADLDEL